MAVDLYPLTESFTEVMTTNQSTSGLNYLSKDVLYMKMKGYPPIYCQLSSKEYDYEKNKIIKTFSNLYNAPQG